MVYEALTAGCRVGVLPVRWKDPRGKIPRALAPLFEQGLALTWEERARMDEPGFSPPVLDEAGRAARELSVAGLIGIPLGLVLVGIRGLWRRAGAAD